MTEMGGDWRFVEGNGMRAYAVNLDLFRNQALALVQWAQANPEAHDRLIDLAMPWWRREERRMWNQAHPAFGEGGING